MKTIPPKQPTTEQNQQRFPTGQLCCYRTMLRKRFTQPTQPSNSKPKSRKTRNWLKFIEFAVVGFATWLNPTTALIPYLFPLWLRSR